MGEAMERRLATLMASLTALAVDRDGSGVADRPGAGDHPVFDVVVRLCGLAAAELGATGAAVSVVSAVRGEVALRELVWGSDPVARRLEELVATLGEGPPVESHTLGAPVLVPDVLAGAVRWPGWALEAAAAGARAVFSLPLQVGVVRLGTLDLYRTAPGGLSSEEYTDALAIARTVTEALLSLVAETGAPAELGWLPDANAQVHQASGMLAARTAMPVGAALLRIRSHAYAHGVPLAEVARLIIAGELHLEPDP